MNPFTWMHMAFRSAVRAEVERAMDDRRRAFARTVPVDDAEIARIRDYLTAHGVTTRAIPTFPAPANDHARPSHPAA